MLQIKLANWVGWLPSLEARMDFETTRMQQTLFSGVSRSFNTSMVPVEALLPTLFTNVTSVDSMEQEINLKSKFNAIVKSNCSRLRTTFLFTTDQISSM